MYEQSGWHRYNGPVILKNKHQVVKIKKKNVMMRSDLNLSWFMQHNLELKREERRISRTLLPWCHPSMVIHYLCPRLDKTDNPIRPGKKNIVVSSDTTNLCPKSSDPKIFMRDLNQKHVTGPFFSIKKYIFLPTDLKKSHKVTGNDNIFFVRHNARL